MASAESGSILIQMAGDLPAVDDFEGGRGCVAMGCGFGAAGGEGAAFGGIEGGGGLAGEGDVGALLFCDGVNQRRRSQEVLGVGVERGVKDELCGAGFDKMAQIHDGDLGGDVSDHFEVVGDKEVGEAELFLEAKEEGGNLGLDGGVEGGERLVADEEVGLEGQGAGNGDALSLSAAKLVGIAFLGGSGQVDLQEQLVDIDGSSVDEGWFLDDFSDRHAGVEGAVGVLEDHLHFADHAQISSLGEEGSV